MNGLRLLLVLDLVEAIHRNLRVVFERSNGYGGG
jgi:hypothetical protein